MADITQVAADVGYSTTAPGTRTGVAGEALTEGAIVYLKSTDNKYYECDVTAATGTAESATAIGIVATPAAIDEKVSIMTSGDVECGGPTTQGVLYVCSSLVNGNIAPIADVATTDDYVTVVGWGLSGTNLLRLAFNATGLQIP